MASTDDDTRGSFAQTGDTRPAPGAMNPAWGRSSRDLATDSPAGFGPDPIAGTDVDTFSDSDADTDGRDDSIRRERKRNPDIPPDARLGLRPTVPAAVVMDRPDYVVSRARTRMVTGLVAGLAAAALAMAVMYALFVTGILRAQSFSVTSRAWFGDRGAPQNLWSIAAYLAAGSLFGLLFALLIKRPTPAKGIVFGVLPGILIALFATAGPAAMAVLVLLNMIVWGFATGRLCSWWLRTPSTTGTTPTPEATV